MYTREQTKIVKIGVVAIGGGNPIAIQSMTTTDTADVSATISQIQALTEVGCEIVRVAVLNTAAAAAIKPIKQAVKIPVVADIHFDYRLVMQAIANGADKIRINPGNIGDKSRVMEVVKAAKNNGIPIRIGVNGGSLEKDLLAKHGGVTAAGICESALRHIQILEDCQFDNIVLALKCSDVPLTIAAYKLICEKVQYPLHVGITEAGSPYRGTIKSAVGIGALLAMGIGDTLRVSLTGDPLQEIKVAKEILQAIGLRKFHPEIISCPTCGRCDVNLPKYVQQVEDFCDTIKTPISVAVMGCVVNGPGEARAADFGIAFAGRLAKSTENEENEVDKINKISEISEKKGAIFQKGQIIKTANENILVDELIKIIGGEMAEVAEPK
ncbi:MAG: flavodoxin-dependent (E)-4-hydroxy-3-methylbut-2-enyl-diphosphate synthase [Defluviitaleaceae bacterium]|nr:flavodoxin-dependent (E)-4-hydroxy-3-methylbut-2-enyl-diphosphate synthase [Defluviitaleaceae bacterium]